MRISWLLLLALASAPASATWLKMDKSQDGFLFTGAEEGEPFSFNVPGNEVRTAKDGDRAFAEIDGVVLQIFLSPTDHPGEIAGLTHYATGEKKYLESAGATISESATCSMLEKPHQEWSAEIAGNKSYYLTVNAGKRILVVVAVASKPEMPASTVTNALVAVCSSLTVA